MQGHNEGFVLPAVLVICAIALLAASVAASLAAQTVETTRADDRALGAACAARAGVAAAEQALSWEPQADATSSLRGRLSADQTYEVRMTPSAAAAPAGTRSFAVCATGSCGASRQVVNALIAVRPCGLPAGLACAGDCEVEAPTTVAGMGVYAGGDVYGREHVKFVPAADGTDADLMHADLWRQQGAHAVGSIYVAGGEEHAGGEACATDSDCHVGLTVPPALVALPGAVELAELRAHAVAPGAALAGACLHIDRLPALPPTGAATGIVVVVAAPESGAALHIVGSREPPPSCCRLTLVVVGDAVAGDAGAGLSFSGALIATGGVRVGGEVAIEGSVGAARLTVAAPLRIATPPWWATSPPSGYASCVLRALE